MHIPILLRGHISVRKRTRTSTGFPDCILSAAPIPIRIYAHINNLIAQYLWRDLNSHAFATVSKTAVYSIPPHRHFFEMMRSRQTEIYTSAYFSLSQLRTK